MIYLTQRRTCRRFPRRASPDLFSGVARNFQVFDPLDFIAELTQHIPDPRKRLRETIPDTTTSTGPPLE